jgi:hypothetical protein
MDALADEQATTTTTALFGAMPQTNSITSDRGILNQQVNLLATSITSNNGDLTTALAAIAAAINAKPSA